MNASLPKALLQFAAQLRFPQLFFLALTLFAVDVLVPDVIPFADEILLGLLTLVFAGLRRARQ